MSTTAQTNPDGYRIAVFGFDAAEAAQRRRIRAWMQCGFSVIGFTMRRTNMTHDKEPFWNNVDLGETRNAALKQRLWRIITSLRIIWCNREKLNGVQTIIARNLDMLIVAMFARFITRSHPRMVYEVLDIHSIMTAGGAKGHIARWLERQLLKRTSALIVSSPAFIREYFEPLQNWSGEVHLLENKLWAGDRGPARPTPPQTSSDSSISKPIVLGWVGTLRCPQSLEILTTAAECLPDTIRIEMHGIVHHKMLPDFDKIVSAHENMTWHGAYNYPDDLERIYLNCDAVWVQDLWQWGANSTWLLPNRIYEAGYFGCPSIAVAGTETGRRVFEGLGWTISSPTSEALLELLDTVTIENLYEKRCSILTMPESLFLQSKEEITATVL